MGKSYAEIQAEIAHTERVCVELDRAYAARQMARINSLSDGPSSQQSLAAINKIANTAIWTLPRSMHGPFLRVMAMAQGAMRG